MWLVIGIGGGEEKESEDEMGGGRTGHVISRFRPAPRTRTPTADTS